MALMDLQKREDTALPLLRRELKEKLEAIGDAKEITQNAWRRKLDKRVLVKIIGE